METDQLYITAENILNNLIKFTLLYLSFFGGRIFVKGQKYDNGFFKSLFIIARGGIIFFVAGMCAYILIYKNYLSSGITCLTLHLLGVFVEYNRPGNWVS